MGPLEINEKTTMRHTYPTVVQDGNLVNIGEDGHGNLLFYQIRKITGTHIDEIDIVASIYVANLEDLKNYRDSLSRVIETFEKREK